MVPGSRGRTAGMMRAGMTRRVLLLLAATRLACAEAYNYDFDARDFALLQNKTHPAVDWYETCPSFCVCVRMPVNYTTSEILPHFPY